MIDKQIELYNDDCLEVFKNIEDESVDLICTDPPYKKVQGGCTNHAVTLKGALREEMAKGTFFKHNEIKFENWIPEIYRVLKNDTHCYIFSDDRNLNDILTIGKKVGFKLLNILTWKKTKHCPNRYYLKNSEFIVMFRKGRAKNINNMGTYQILEFNNVEKKVHPSEKPLDLLETLISNSSNMGDVVMDPFMGSGTCGITCKKLNRNFIGIELEEKYFNIAKGRIENDR